MYTTHLEDYINDLYKHAGVHDPLQLDMHSIAHKLGIKITYWKINFFTQDEIILVPDKKEREWQVFGHELCHYLIHYGHQLNMHYLFRQLQEYQANNFAYHFCVPTFMLQSIKGVTIYDVMGLFNVDFDFAYTRLEMYKNKILNERIDEHARTCG